MAGVDGIEGGGCGEWSEIMTWIDELNGIMMQFEVWFLRTASCILGPQCQMSIYAKLIEATIPSK